MLCTSCIACLSDPSLQSVPHLHKVANLVAQLATVAVNKAIVSVSD